MTAYIAVVGPGDGATPQEIALAHELGALLAARGATVLTGGAGGVMAAAVEGAAAHGGPTVDLLPGSERVGSNASVAIPTGLGELRNGLLVRAADAVIAIGGSWGTLSEIALAMRTGVPVVLLGGWDVTGPADAPRRASTPAEAVAAVLG